MIITNLKGEVSEWFKVQTWNVCVGATPPGVRIPPSPIFNKGKKCVKYILNYDFNCFLYSLH